MDPDNCGQCGVVCRPNAGLGIGMAFCAVGTCAYSCAQNYADCDGDVTNGCEDLSEKQRCGSCSTNCRNRNCVLVNGTYQCG